MKILGAGLSRTGTTSLAAALELLGFKSIHYDPYRLLRAIEGREQNFRAYDDIEAVTDIPAATYWRELLKAYPKTKVILTIRDVESWWQSMMIHCLTLEERFHRSHRHSSLADIEQEISLARLIHRETYGSEVPDEELYKKRYQEHNAAIMKEIPPDKLLVMDLNIGDNWNKLCSFVNRPLKSGYFPLINKGLGF